LYRKIEKENGEIIVPGALDTDGVVKTSYTFFPKSEVEGEYKVASADQITFTKQDSIDYSLLTPVYNTNGAKTRSIDAKESNYFNIL
jgi:hypothetical protein